MGNQDEKQGKARSALNLDIENTGTDQKMRNIFKAASGKGYELNRNTDGTIDIRFRQQIMDPAMMTIFIFPTLFFTSCSGVFAVGNTYGMPGGIITAIFLLAAVFIAGYIGIGFFNSKESRIKIIPGQAIEFGNQTLTRSDIEKIGTQSGNMGANSFRVYALAGGEKIFITEYVPAAMARAIQNGIQEHLNEA